MVVLFCCYSLFNCIWFRFFKSMQLSAVAKYNLLNSLQNLRSPSTQFSLSLAKFSKCLLLSLWSIKGRHGLCSKMLNQQPRLWRGCKIFHSMTNLWWDWVYSCINCSSFGYPVIWSDCCYILLFLAYLAKLIGFMNTMSREKRTCVTFAFIRLWFV